MKQTLLAAIAFCFLLQTQAQYFQRQQNYIFPAQVRDEEFLHGIRATQNYSGGNPNNFYWVGLGNSYNNNPFLPFPHNTTHRERFVRFDRGGLQTGSRAFDFGNPAAAATQGWYNSFGASVAEIYNGLGTGGFISVGRVESNSVYANATVPGGSDALYVVHGAAGAVVTAVQLDFSGLVDEATSVRQSTFMPGTWLVCGNTIDFGNSFWHRPWVARMDAAGNVLWAYTFTFFIPGALADARAYSICENPTTGFVYVAGAIGAGLPPTDDDGLIFSLSAGGTFMWANRYGLPLFNEEFRVIRSTWDNQLMTGGSSDAFVPLNYNTWMTKVQAVGGTVLWSNILTATQGAGFFQSKCFDLQERYSVANAAYEYYLAGPMYTGTGPYQHVFKTDVNGNVMDNWTYNPLATDHGCGLDVNDVGVANSKGVAVFSNIPTTLAGALMNSYIQKSYFNGAICFNSCQTSPPATSPISLVVQILNPTIGTTYTRTVVKTRYWNHAQATICQQANVGCGSNAKTDETEEALEEQLTAAIGELKLYPNPATAQLSIAVQTAEAGEYKIEAIDLLGRTISLGNTWLDAGNATVETDVNDLAAGQYIIRLSSETTSVVKRLVKVNE